MLLRRTPVIFVTNCPLQQNMKIIVRNCTPPPPLLIMKHVITWGPLTWVRSIQWWPISPILPIDAFTQMNMLNESSHSKLQVLCCKSPSCTGLNNSPARVCERVCVYALYLLLLWWCSVLRGTQRYDGQRWSLCAVAGLFADVWLRSPSWNSCVIMKLFSSQISNGGHHSSSLELKPLMSTAQKWILTI